MIKTVLITGAQGNIGKKLRAHLSDRYTLKLLDINSGGDPDITVMDLSKWDDRILGLCSGVDAIVHLAADPYDNKSWLELMPPNLDALNNIFIAAVKAQVPRVIFASSNHTMGGYKDTERKGRWLTTELEPKPGTEYEGPGDTLNDSTPYGAMKLCGERLGLCYAQSTTGVCIAIRVGWVNRAGENRPEDLPEEANTWFKRMWLSTRDMCQLMEQSITVPKPPGTFLVVNGMSDNEGMVWDIDYTHKVLGYSPQDGLTSDFKART
jgi:nucleoside-diphosphate-sugar epimerase